MLIARGNDTVMALGPSDEGICDYSETMRQALLNHNEDEFFECDESTYTSTSQAAWAGDLDVEPYVGATFAPGKGELDGYELGSRVDLRGSGLGISDLDVSAALDSHGTPGYQRFGVDVAGSDYRANSSGGFVGLTFLLDRAASSNSGLTASAFEGTEGQVVWFTFQWSSVPDELEDWNNADAGDDGFWLVLKLHVEIDSDERQLFFMVNSEDAARTLYAAPFLVPDDFDIERSERADVTLTAEAVSDARPTDSLPDDSAYTSAQDDAFEEIERAISRNDDARLTIHDDDSPQVDVCDRTRTVRDALVAEVSGQDDCDQISVNDLAEITSLDLGDSEIEQLKAGDFSGLSELTSLDLSENDLRSLPADVFAGVGSGLDAPNVAFIDVSLNPGPRGVGFSLRNVSSGLEASVGPRQAVRLAAYESSDDPEYGLTDTRFSVQEGTTLVLGLRALPQSAVLFRSLAGDSGTYETEDCLAPCEAPGASEIEEEGEYLVGFAVPEDSDDDDDTFTILYGESTNAADLDTIQSVARLTVTESPGTGVVTPPTASIFTTVQVIDTSFSTTRDSPEFPYNPDLDHNISDLRVTVGGQVLVADFLDYFNRTGGRERWGFATSEVIEIEPGTLTQFFQRGVIDFHDVGFGWIVERRLAWDYFGGGLGGSVDQRFEPPPASPPPGPSEFFAGFQHYVANTAVDGTATGFLDFFNRLGGVDSFGIPKTEARRDTNGPGMLTEGKTPGFVRQYFQAAIFQLAANGQVQLTLLGDSLRDLLVPDHADYQAFRRAAPFTDGQFFVPQRII